MIGTFLLVLLTICAVVYALSKWKETARARYLNWLRESEEQIIIESEGNEVLACITAAQFYGKQGEHELAAMRMDRANYLGYDLSKLVEEMKEITDNYEAKEYENGELGWDEDYVENKIMLKSIQITSKKAHKNNFKKQVDVSLERQFQK